MALIKPGIHENMVLSDKTKINDKGTLELCIKTVENPNDLLAAFEGNETFQSMESSMRFYPPNMADFDKNLKNAGDLAKDILGMRHQLLQYAYLYAPKEEGQAAIGGLAMFEGLGIPPENMAKAINMLTNEEFMKKAVTNLCTKFVAFLKAKNAFSGEVKFRHKFLRQSKAKNFAVIPNSSFDVWIESMDIPKEASVIAFSQWEIDNKKNDPNPAASDKSQVSEEDANKARSLFSAPANAVASDPEAEATTTEAAPATEGEAPPLFNTPTS